MNELIQGTLSSIHDLAMRAMISAPPYAMGSQRSTLKGKAFAFVWSQQESLFKICQEFDAVGVRRKDLTIYIPEAVFGNIDEAGPYSIRIKSYPGYEVFVGFELRLIDNKLKATK